MHAIHVTAAATTTPRLARLDGREHLVVPVVALVEGVIRPLGASAPEFVPADVLRMAPSSWDGRPVVGPHPMDGGRTPASANTPDRLEARTFGRIFNTRYDETGKRLAMEAWIDIERARTLGGDALRVLERARKGAPIEVSVGAMVVTEPASGVYQGRAYRSIWRVAMPDHLALLPEGQIGACSNAMGCGVRAAMEGTMRFTFEALGGGTCCATDDPAQLCGRCRELSAAEEQHSSRRDEPGPDGWGPALRAGMVRAPQRRDDPLDPWAIANEVRR